MFAVVGLALDIIGALALTFVLFQQLSITFGGERAKPAEARDRALGVVGASFFVFGFVCQLLPHFGFGGNGTNASRGFALAATLLGGPLCAGILFVLLRRVFLPITVQFADAYRPSSFDRHDAQHVSPVRLILEDLAQLRLGRFPCQEEVKGVHLAVPIPRGEVPRRVFGAEESEMGIPLVRSKWRECLESDCA